MAAPSSSSDRWPTQSSSEKIIGSPMLPADHKAFPPSADLPPSGQSGSDQRRPCTLLLDWGVASLRASVVWTTATPTTGEAERPEEGEAELLHFWDHSWDPAHQSSVENDPGRLVRILIDQVLETFLRWLRRAAPDEQCDVLTRVVVCGAAGLLDHGLWPTLHLVLEDSGQKNSLGFPLSPKKNRKKCGDYDGGGAGEEIPDTNTPRRARAQTPTFGAVGTNTLARRRDLVSERG